MSMYRENSMDDWNSVNHFPLKLTSVFQKKKNNDFRDE